MLTIHNQTDDMIESSMHHPRSVCHKLDRNRETR